MPTRICLSLFGILLLVLVGAWASWDDTSPRNAWILDDPVRILTDFTPQEKLDLPFRLRNTSRKPLRILGAGYC